MLGTDAFRGHDLDLRIVLSALKTHHCTMALATPDDAHHLVSFVSSVLLATVRDPYTPVGNVERMLHESVEDDEREEHYSLQEIFGKQTQGIYSFFSSFLICLYLLSSLPYCHVST